MMSRVPNAQLDELIEASRQQHWELLRDYLSAYARTSPVRKVAVVGNAPLAPSAERAEEIDSADLVIRVNAMMLDGPGDPPSLGTVCHAVILSRSTTITPWVFHDYRHRAYLVPQAGFVEYHPGDTMGLLLDAPFWPADLGALPVSNAVVKARLVRAMDPTHRPGSVIPTTGTIALYLAHEMFASAELVCAGFSFLDDPDQKSWSHHSGGHTKINWRHRLDLESQLLRTWIHDGSVRPLP